MSVVCLKSNSLVFDAIIIAIVHTSGENEFNNLRFLFESICSDECIELSPDVVEDF